jgi:probable HAF family extracellular repeat protein
MTVSRSGVVICALAILTLAFVPALTSEHPQAQTQPGPYSVTDLGPVGSVSAQAYDINDAGQVALTATRPTIGTRALVWQNGAVTELASVPSSAGGISPTGLVTGHIRISPTVNTRAVIFENGGVTDLGVEGGAGSAINDHRQVVGTFGTYTGFLWDNGVVTQINDAGGGASTANDINNAGQIVGAVTTPEMGNLGPIWRAYVWQNGVMTNLGALPGHIPGADTGASAINSLGQIVGTSSFTDEEVYTTDARPFLYDGGTMTAIPVPSSESYAGDINDLGHVVGSMRAGGGVSNWHGFIFKDGVAWNLNSLILPGSGLHITFAHAINNEGQIVGMAYDSRAGQHAVLLTPVAADTPVVSVGDASVTEGHSGTRAANVVVSLSRASSQPVSVSFNTSDGTASASDYQSATGSVTFNPGETSKTITVLVNGDRVGEPNETVGVILSSPINGAVLGDSQGAVTIVDDEPRVTINDVSKNEGQTGTTPFVFTVTLSAASDIAVTMDFATVEFQAKALDDYIAQSGSLTFNPGQTSKTITIGVRGDRKVEFGEFFYVSLLNISAGFAPDWQGSGLIRNDDK